jgi:hypothetical protein
MQDLTRVQDLASPLVGRSSLIEIRLFESHGRHVQFPDPEAHVAPSDLSVGISTVSDPDTNTAVFLMQAEVSVQQSLMEVGDSDDGSSEEVANFTVAFGGLYSLDDDLKDIPDGSLDAFGQCVAALALWPYIRAEMARLSEAMHLSPLTLPMLTQQDIAELID